MIEMRDSYKFVFPHEIQKVSNRSDSLFAIIDNKYETKVGETDKNVIENTKKINKIDTVVNEQIIKTLNTMNYKINIILDNDRESKQKWDEIHKILTQKNSLTTDVN